MTRSEPPAEVIEAHGWVIEGAWSDVSVPQYWAGSSLWMSDHMCALRFARAHDAQQAASAMLDGMNIRICEHIWIGDRLRASSSLGGIEGGVQREDALTAGALKQEKAATLTELKCWQPYFEDIVQGRKTFELRKNDRGGFKIGDMLRLVEVERGALLKPPQDDLKPTGRTLDVIVTYCLIGGKFGLETGYCILGISKLTGLAEQTQAPVAGIRSEPPSRDALEKIERATSPDEPDNSATTLTETEHAYERALWILGQIARAALSSDGRGREKGNTSNSDDGIDPAPPATDRSASQ